MSRSQSRPHTFIRDLKSVCGPDGVLTHTDDLKVYECDAYTLHKQAPDAVALPRSTEEVITILQCCAKNGVPIIPRGSGTSLSGATLPVDGGLILCLSRMNQILDVDVRNRRALVEAGCVNAHVTRAVQGHGLFYAPDPSSQFACTIGGNIATNSGGPHTLKNGVTTNHVLGLELVMADGEVVWLGTQFDGPEDTEGYDLRGVVIGSEGMFGVVTRAVLKLSQIPPCVRTLLGVFETVDQASQTVSDIIAAGIVPGAMEMMDQLITQAIEEAYHFGFPLDAGALLIVELDGLEAGMQQQVDRVIAICRENGARKVDLARDESERQALWKCRKRAFGAIGRLSPNYLTQDGVVPRSRLPEIMSFIRMTSDKYELRIPNVFHAGDGNIHPLILYDERDPAQVKRAIQAGNDILTKCLEMGGSVSGEHGIGVEKTSFMSKQFSPFDLNAMSKVRDVFDPDHRCNPHKVLPSARRCIDFAPKRQIAA